MASTVKLPENVSTYTELREAANSILTYASFASISDIIGVQSALTEAVTGQETEEGRICEKLLGNSEPIPGFDAAKILFGPYADQDLANQNATVQKAASPNIKAQQIFPFNTAVSSYGESVTKKKVSLFQHAAQARVDYSTSLTDISALFCNLIPPVEMSLCVPYFDVRVTYPQDSAGQGQLSALRFVGYKAPSAPADTQAQGISRGYIASDMVAKFGFDVAGMEIFSMPQTMADETLNLNSPDAISNRGVTVLDPLVPLLTLESANIQQTGIGGSLYAQTKVDLKMVLHDRSRLSDIEPLVSAEIFPAVNFRITYGWSHPDTNKMSGGVYAKLLNAMRITQNFAVQNVSLSTRDATSMSISISLISTGSLVSKSAKVLSANGNYVPYTMVLTLLKQIINIKNSTSNSSESTTNFSKVGTSLLMSTSDSSSASRFVKVEDFYNLYDFIKNITSRTGAIDSITLAELIKQLNRTDVLKLEPQAVADEFSSAVTFVKSASDNYGNIQTFDNKFFIPNELSDFVNKVNEEVANFSLWEAPPPVVTLYDAVTQLVAKPILLSQPDVEEVRIHCFSFNSACGEMSEENIGNFPIILADLVQKEGSSGGLTVRSSAETALNLILKQVNDPSSNFFGHGSLFYKREQAIKQINEGSANSNDPEGVQINLEQALKNYEALIDARNAGILARKGISGDTAFVPAKVKSTTDTLDIIGKDGSPSDKKIVRIVIYDDRTGGFNKQANLIFSMMNSNGFGLLNTDSATELLKSDVFKFKNATPASEGKPAQTTVVLADKGSVRQIAMNLHPCLIVGSEGSLVTNASYSSQPSGDVASGYLLTAIQGAAGSPTGKDVNPNMIDDVLVIPSSITLSMAGNTCITRGQTYCVDFGTGTTLDNAYTVQSVSHSIRPGSFTTSVTMMPTNGATMRSVTRQISELENLIKPS